LKFYEKVKILVAPSHYIGIGVVAKAMIRTVSNAYVKNLKNLLLCSDPLSAQKLL
jgi:hypothetical protein